MSVEQDKEETTSEVSWTGNEKEVWRLEPEGEAERPEATVPWKRGGRRLRES